MDFSRYIDFDDPDGPKLVGHRIWLHDIIAEVVGHNPSDLQLVERFDTLNREKVLAALLYFEQNRDACLRAYEAEEARRAERAAQWAEQNREWVEEFRRRREAFRRERAAR